MKKWEGNIVLFLFLGLMFLPGCQKKINVSEVQESKLLLMIGTRPDAYVWSIGRTTGTAVLFGMVGLIADGAINDSLGKKFSNALKDYPLEAKLVETTTSKLKENGFGEIVLICGEGLKAGELGCKEYENLAGLKKEYSGSKLLVVKPCEWGLRSDVPYLDLKAVLFDLTSEKKLWRSDYVLKNDEIETMPSKLEYFTENNGELLKKALDLQIPRLVDWQVKHLAAKTEEKPKSSWIYAGCAGVQINLLKFSNSKTTK